MEEKAYVYQIRNKINNKLYIGSSKRIESRLWTHKNELKKGVHVNKKLQNAWNKYGEDNFEFEIIEECDLEEQYVREQYYMDLHEVCRDGYNILSTAKYGHADGQPWVKGENSNLAKITENQAYGVKLMDSLGYKPKEISEKLDVTESNVRNILDLTTWIDVGKEFNKRLKQNKEENKTKKISYELALNEYFNDGIKIAILAEKYNIKEHTLYTRINKVKKENKIKEEYEKAKSDNRIKVCIICGEEIILKRKNSNKKYCKECAIKVKKQQSVFRQRKLRSK